MHLTRGVAGRKAKFRATNSITQSVLDIRSHEKNYLALQSALSHSSIVNQATICGYYWKKSETIQCASTNMEQQTHILDCAIKVKIEEDAICMKKIFINSYFVSILKDKDSKVRNINKFTKYLFITRKKV